MADRDVEATREKLRLIVVEWLGYMYNEDIGDTSNPDYVDPLMVRELINQLMEVMK